MTKKGHSGKTHCRDGPRSTLPMKYLFPLLGCVSSIKQMDLSRDSWHYAHAASACRIKLCFGSFSAWHWTKFRGGFAIFHRMGKSRQSGRSPWSISNITLSAPTSSRMYAPWKILVVGDFISSPYYNDCPLPVQTITAHTESVDIRKTMAFFFPKGDDPLIVVWALHAKSSHLIFIITGTNGVEHSALVPKTNAADSCIAECTSIKTVLYMG